MTSPAYQPESSPSLSLTSPAAAASPQGPLTGLPKPAADPLIDLLEAASPKTLDGSAPSFPNPEAGTNPDSGPVVSAPPKDEIRAALLIPLSGPNAVLGQALSNAAQLALFDQNDVHFNLIPLDSKGTAEGAAAAARQARTQGAHIILGPLFSAEVKAVAPIAREQGIPMLAFTTDKSAIGNGVYTLGSLPSNQIRRVIEFARQQGKERFAVLARNDDYGHTVADAAREIVGSQNAKLVKVEYYDLQSSENMQQVVKRFTEVDARMRGRTKETETPVPPPPFDAVIIPDDGVRLRTVSSLVTYYQVDPDQVRLLGTMLWDNARLSNEPSLQGGWYPAPASESRLEFDQRYQTAFKSVPPAIASLAYDSTALAAMIGQKTNGDFSANALTNPQGFAGVDGLFRLLPDGTSERGLAVKEVTKGGNREVSPAPLSFPR